MGETGQIQLLEILVVPDQFRYYLKGGGGINIVIHLTVYEEELAVSSAAYHALKWLVRT